MEKPEYRAQGFCLCQQQEATLVSNILQKCSNFHSTQAAVLT